MRKYWLLISICILFLGLTAAHAQGGADMREVDGAVPRNLHWGLDLLRRDSYEEAERQILVGSRIPSDGRLAGPFRSSRLESGQYQGFQVISSQAITPRLRVIYLVLKYERAPYFLKFTVYRTPDGWVVLRSPVWIAGEDDLEPLLANRPTAQ